jgi:ornithine cyclodeaminase/alanine dehydrogenase
MLLLSSKDVESLLEIEKLPAIIEDGFRAYATGQAAMPPKVYLDLPQYKGDFRAMPAYLKGACGLKWVCFYPLNPQNHGLPTVTGILIYSDPTTGMPLAIMEASSLTSYRTAAASAVAIRYLANPGAKTLGIVGCGAQAQAHIRILTGGFSFDCIYLYDLDPARAIELKRLFPDLPIKITSLEETCNANVLCTLTPARKPVIQKRFLKPGIHINAMGADAPGKQELDMEILKQARIFVDDMEQSIHGGEINVAISSRVLTKENIAGTLGEVVAGKCPGRQTKDEITVFDSTGLAIQDIALAAHLYERAVKQKAGMEVELF